MRSLDFSVRVYVIRDHVYQYIFKFPFCSDRQQPTEKGLQGEFPPCFTRNQQYDLQDRPFFPHLPNLKRLLEDEQEGRRRDM